MFACPAKIDRTLSARFFRLRCVIDRCTFCALDGWYSWIRVSSFTISSSISSSVEDHDVDVEISLSSAVDAPDFNDAAETGAPGIEQLSDANICNRSMVMLIIGKRALLSR